FRLTGPTPLLPRYALGNWWSRYWKYTDTEYLGLLDRFDAERVPFSVAVIDMDWHLVDIDPELGTGWTGYSWNRELFPDPPAFLDRLHERGLAVTLNVHPADGVRRHEDHYPAMARALGLDPERGEQIPFDVTDRRFVEAYLRELHHPLEDEGVDFWWLDWQSGGVTGVAGLDPLWMLNHVHYQDSGRGGRRPITFSRYSGPGAHRYPVGFSGDTIITWESLDFQPYFTATAANVGFYWWSNDVGGHMFGYRDPELAVRWFQLGVFSPINRLHSSSSAFTGKEPWRYGPEAAGVMSRFLRLRHLLVPYLYSAAWAAHTDGVGVVRPVYHDHPVAGQAYAQRNQFLFGPDLLVAPITAPADDRAQVAVTSAWLPDGEWFDLFTGNRYRGGRTVALHRPLGQYPVLARGGTVLPLAASAAADVRENPGELVLRVFPGAGSTTMVEDAGQGEPRPEDRQLTHVEVTWRGDELVLTIDPPTGPGALTTRRIAVDLAGAQSAGRALLACAGEEHEIDGVPTAGEAAELFGPALRLDLGELDLADGVRLTVHGVRPGAVALGEQAFDLLDRAQIPFVDKERALDAVGRLSGAELAGELATIDLPETLRHALLEVAACAQD
ncbi:MAG: glycoside hydrolase family 31 protein, partial [Cellulomonadaceae bacterium]